jgi:multiple sugar transport system substrate-binding protein
MARKEISLSGPYVVVALLVAAVVLLTLLTRGTPIEDQYEGKRVLRVSFEMNLSEINEVWNAVKSDFEEQHPDVVIVLIDDINDKSAIYEAANKLPDIISTNTFSLHRYKNSILPLDDLVVRDRAEVQLDDFYPDIVESCRYEGDLFLIPYFFNVSLLYYNIDMFAAAGVALPTTDWTWADYVHNAQQLTNFYRDQGVEKHGTTILHGWWIEWLCHVHQAGGQFIGDDWHHSPMDSPEAIEGLQFFNDLVNVHEVSPKPKDILPYTFMNQHAAMEWGGHTENWVGMRKNAEFRWDVTLLPRHPSNSRGSERVSVGMGINKNSPHRELAWEFIKYMASYESHRKLCAAGYVPVRQSVANDEFFKKDADGRYSVDPQNKGVIFAAYASALRDQSLLPEFPALAQRHALPHISAMLAGDLSAEECGKAIAEEVTNALKMIDRPAPKATKLRPEDDHAGQ